MIAADLLQDVELPFAKPLFAGMGVKFGNSHADGPFDTPVRVDKLPAQPLGQFSSYMTFAAPHHAYENNIPFHRRTSLA